MSKEIKKVLVIGCGVMGSSIAQVFAANGYETVMADNSQEALDKAHASVKENLEGLKQIGMYTEEYGANVEKNLSSVLDTEVPAIADTFDFVAEAVFENADVKRGVYKMLSDNCREDCIFGSNTSGMDIFKVAGEVITHPERLIITHFFQPPHMMKLVEIVRGDETSDEVCETMVEMMKKCGKKPAVINTYIPGFIVNRMCGVVLREVFYMIKQGWSTPQDIETALKYVDGLRWSFEGPQELIDVTTLELAATVFDGVGPTLCNDEIFTDYLRDLIAQGKNGVRSGSGALKDYPKDTFAYFTRRNKRILKMINVMNEFEREDEEDPLV